MKEKFERPEIEVIQFEEDDVVTASQATITGTGDSGTEVDIP